MKKVFKVLFIVFILGFIIVPVSASEELKVELVAKTGCDAISPLKEFLQLALNYIRMIGIVMAVIMQVIDYFKGCFSGKCYLVVKVNLLFLTKIIAVGLLFLIPSIIIFIMDILKIPGTSSGTCGIY